MCMAATFDGKGHYFGRNLDYEVSFGQRVVVTPRDYEFRYRNGILDRGHYAMIGMATVADGYPLYFDATNEKGLSMAGLNFPGNAYYGPRIKDKDNIASFEFIPWVLGRCRTLDEARDLISGTNIVDEQFSKEFPSSPLHWMVSDGTGSLTVEQTGQGMCIYDNPVGILTNNPPFPHHMYNLADHMGASAGKPENRMCPAIDLAQYSRGMGAMGLPGDLSSASRFVKAAFTKLNSRPEPTDEGELSQFFHIMASVEQQRGCCDLGDGKYEHTLYTSCCDTVRGIYYYRLYGNSQICGVDMHATELDSEELHEFALAVGEHVFMHN